MLVGSSQSPLSVSGFRNDIFGPYDDKIFLFFSFAFLSIFVCATSGTNVNDIRRIDFKNFRYPLDEPDESDKTTWRWTQLSLQSKVLLIVLAKEHGVQSMGSLRGSVHQNVVASAYLRLNKSQREPIRLRLMTVTQHGSKSGASKACRFQ